MINSIFATKLDMTQAWSKQGKRLAVTRCQVGDNSVVDQKTKHIFEIGYGTKKLKNMSKPLRAKMQQSGFSFGVKQLQGISIKPQSSDLLKEAESTPLKRGDLIKVDQVLAVGDMVKVQGITKGRGFTGVIKRHGFHGGQRTHGQSDRERAPGSIGAGTDPGRVWKGKKMPGSDGASTRTVHGLTVLYIDQKTNEIWLSGPIPGYYSSIIKITKIGQKKIIELDQAASGIIKVVTEEKSAELDQKSVKDKKQLPIKEKSAEKEAAEVKK